MVYWVEIDNCNLVDFPAWAGGAEVLKELKDHPDHFDFIENYLDQYTAENDLSKTEVNDFLWFDALDVLHDYGYYDRENDIWLEII